MSRASGRRPQDSTCPNAAVQHSVSLSNVPRQVPDTPADTGTTTPLGADPTPAPAPEALGLPLPLPAEGLAALPSLPFGMSWKVSDGWLHVLHNGHLRFHLYRDDRGYHVLLPQDEDMRGTRRPTFAQALALLLEALDV